MRTQNLRRVRPTALVVLLCASLTLTVIYNGGVTFLPARSLTEGAIGFLPMLGILVSYRTVAARRPPVMALIIAGAYLIAVSVSGMINGNEGAPILVLLAPAVTAVAFILSGALMSVTDFRQVARWVAVLAAVQTVLAFAEVQAQQPWATGLASTDGVYLFRPNLVVEGIGRASGTMGHPILLGLLCTMAALLVLSPAVVRSRLLRAVLVVGFSYGVLLSGSRSSIAALGLGLVIYYLHPMVKGVQWVRVLMVLVFIPVLWTYVSEAIVGAKTVSLFSLTNRLDAWPRFLDTLGRPFGQAMFGEGPKYTLDTVADNQFLTVSGHYGLFGLIVLLVAMVYAFFSKTPAVTAGVAVLAFMGLSFDALEWGFSAAMFWLLVGLSHGGGVTPADPPGSQSDFVPDARHVYEGGSATRRSENHVRA